MKNMKRIVLDYISGNDIEEYTLDELENNPEFMLEAMKFSKDKKIYNFCSENIKNNPDFIKEIIILFKDDKKFIISIVDEYFSKIGIYNESFYELNILMSNILENDEESYRFKLETGILYTITINVIKTELNHKINQNSDKLETAFFNIENIYEGYEIIIDYFAKRFINKIFSDISNDELEKKLHSNFKEISDLTDENINSFIINNISLYDKELALYSINHENLLNDVKKVVVSYIPLWNSFYEREMNNKINMFYDMVDNYFNIHEDDISGNYNQCDFIELAIKKLNLQDTFKKYDPYWSIEDDKDTYLPFNEEYYKIFDGYHNDDINEMINLNQQMKENNEEFKFNEKKLTLLEIKALKFVLVTADNIFNKNNIIQEEDNYCQEENKNKKKAIIKTINFPQVKQR